MAWKVEFSKTAIKQLGKIDKKWQLGILDYLEYNIAMSDNPRAKGKALVGDKKGLWRYKVGDYRIICDIEDENLSILALAIGHRKEIYESKN